MTFRIRSLIFSRSQDIRESRDRLEKWAPRVNRGLRVNQHVRIANVLPDSMSPDLTLTAVCYALV